MLFTSFSLNSFFFVVDFFLYVFSLSQLQQILWIKSFQSGMCEDLIEKCGLRNSLILLPAERCLPVISSMPAEDAQLLQSSLTQI